MKQILTRLQSFVTFELPLRNSHIQQTFIATHENYRREHQGWSLKATRKKVIADYWNKHVLTHFSALYLAAVLINLPFSTIFNQFVLPGVFMAGLISLPILTFCIYGQFFYFDFLPKLDTVMENYGGNQLQHLKKCQQAQMSNFAVVVIYYALANASGQSISGTNRQYGERLMRLFGKDPDDMSKALKMITCKTPKLSPHKQTEIGKSLEEARSFFEAIEFPQGIKVVDQLDLKLMAL